MFSTEIKPSSPQIGAPYSSMSLAERDARVVWHPYTQMQLQPQALPIVRGEGSYLYGEDGRAYLDMVSSWWVILHGHAQPYLATKIYEQLMTLEQVIFAGFTHPKAVELSERLLAVLPPSQERVFFTDNGSTAVEVALKMALQFWHNRGTPRRQIIALSGAYHGDTFGAMAVSERGLFTRPFQDLLFEVKTLPVPTASTLPMVLAQLDQWLASGDVAAFIFEPLVQGAGGFRFCEPEHLSCLLDLCKGRGVLTIADEVMTGFGRTGRLFASDYLRVEPDLMCMAKGITGGTMPLAVTTCSSEVYTAFLAPSRDKALFHGHSYTANPVACAAACASLDLLLSGESQTQRDAIAAYLTAQALRWRSHPRLTSVRSLGTLFAAEILTQGAAHKDAYLNSVGPRLAAFFLRHGVLVRPLGDTFYLMPPYCTTVAQLEGVFNLLAEFLEDDSAH